MRPYIQYEDSRFGNNLRSHYRALFGCVPTLIIAALCLGIPGGLLGGGGGVGHAGVVHGLEALDEGFLDGGDVAERYGRLVVQPVGYLRVDDAVDQGRDALGGVVGQRAAGGFHAVGHHQQRCLARARVRAHVGVGVLVGRGFAGGFGALAGCDVEVFGKAAAMMLCDEVAHHGR